MVLLSVGSGWYSDIYRFTNLVGRWFRLQELQTLVVLYPQISIWLIYHQHHVHTRVWRSRGGGGGGGHVNHRSFFQQ